MTRQDIDRALPILVVSILIACVSIGVEKAQSHVLRWVSPNTVPVVHALFRELSLLGVVGLIFFVADESGVLRALSREKYGDESFLRAMVQAVDTALFCGMMMFLLLVMLLLKSALRTERQWNDLETHGQFPTTVFTSHQVLRLRLSAEITRLRSRRCGRSRVFCMRCCCCKLRQLRELEVQEQRLVYAAVRARFLVPPAPKREATGARDRRGSLAALMNAHGQRNAYVRLKPDQDSLYREKATVTAVKLAAAFTVAGSSDQAGKAGDWVVTSPDGELAVLKADEFFSEYEPVDNETGRFRSRRRVLGRLMSHPFSVTQGNEQLFGPAGSWLIQNADRADEQRVVTAAEFADVYELAGPVMSDIGGASGSGSGNLPLDFDFALYLSTVYARTVAQIVELGWQAWVVIQVVVAFSWTAQVLLDRSLSIVPVAVLGYSLLLGAVLLWRKLDKVLRMLTSTEAVRKYRLVAEQGKSAVKDKYTKRRRNQTSVSPAAASAQQHAASVPTREPFAPATAGGQRNEPGAGNDMVVAMAPATAAPQPQPQLQLQPQTLQGSVISPPNSENGVGRPHYQQSLSQDDGDGSGGSGGDSPDGSPVVSLISPAQQLQNLANLENMFRNADGGSPVMALELGSSFTTSERGVLGAISSAQHLDDSERETKAGVKPPTGRAPRTTHLPSLRGGVGVAIPNSAMANTVICIESPAQPGLRMTGSLAHLLQGSFAHSNADAAAIAALPTISSFRTVGTESDKSVSYALSVRDMVEHDGVAESLSLFAHTAAKRFAKLIRQRVHAKKKRTNALNKFRQAAKRAKVVSVFGDLQAAVDQAPFERMPLRKRGTCASVCCPQGFCRPRNRHEQLFWFGSSGTAFVRLCIQMLLLMTALYVSVGFTLLINVNGPCSSTMFEATECAVWSVTMMLPPVCILMLVPSSVATFVLVSNVESMRRTDVVREVVQTQYTIQAMRGLRMVSALALNASAGFHALRNMRVAGESFDPFENKDPSSISTPVRKRRKSLTQDMAFNRSHLMASLNEPEADHSPEAVYGAADSGEFQRRQAEIRDVFGMFDRDLKGFVTPDDMRRLLQALGVKDLSEVVLQQVMQSLDENSDGKVEFSEFFHWIAMQDRTQVSNDRAQNAEVTEYMFSLVDKEGTGRVTVDALRRALACMGTFVRYEDLLRMVVNYDSTGTGSLNLTDFARLLREFNKFNKWLM